MRYGVLCENHLYNKVFSARKKAGGKTVVVYYLKDLKANKLRKANPMKEKINRMGISVSKKKRGSGQAQPGKEDHSGGLQADRKRASFEKGKSDRYSGKRRNRRRKNAGCEKGSLPFF